MTNYDVESHTELVDAYSISNTRGDKRKHDTMAIEMDSRRHHTIRRERLSWL